MAQGERNKVTSKRYRLKLGSVPPLQVLFANWVGHRGDTSCTDTGARLFKVNSTPQALEKYRLWGVSGVPAQSRYRSR